jgi:hypothetical protein
VKSPSDNGPARASRQTRTGVRDVDDESAVVANERMTALVSAALLVLLLVELVTLLSVHAMLPVHVLVGVLLAGPLAVKIGSTGYRFLRYYTGSPAFVRRGPPRLALRVLAPLLLATTLVVVGSGIGLLVTGPTHILVLPLVGPLTEVHAMSTMIWIPMFTIHVFAFIRRTPRLIADDWRKRPAEQVPGRGLRLGVSLGALMVGAIAAIIVLPFGAPWIAWFKTTGENDLAPLIVALSVAGVVVLAAKLLRWVEVEG